MNKLAELSVFFPAYNEEANIERTVEKAIPILDQVADKYEVLIVNDGSKDNTGAVAARLAERYPFVRVITHEVNRGYGAAVKSGFYNSRYEWIVFTDSDGQFDFSEVTNFIEKQEQTGADLVIGYYLKRAVGAFTVFSSKVWEFLVFVLFGLRATDTDCGFKMVRKAVIDKIPALEAERGPFITSEFLVKARRAGFKIVEVGVRHYPRAGGKPTGRSLKVIASGFSDLIRLRLSM